jgi:hypothetical protein
VNHHKEQPVSSKYDRSDESELSLEQLDDVTGGAGPAPMGLGGSFAPAATHVDPMATQQQPGMLVTHHGPTIFGNGHPAPLGIVHVGGDGHPVETNVPGAHDTTATHDTGAAHGAGPVGLGGGWHGDGATTSDPAQDHAQQPVAATTGLDPLQQTDLFDPPATNDAAPMGLGGWSGDHE